jgi:hypothetical protein
MCYDVQAKLLRIHTERRTPIPAKTTLAGEKTCQINIRVQISYKRMSLSIPGQHPPQALKKKRIGRSRWGQATLSIDHRFGTDLVPVLVVEERREWRLESRNPGAGARGDGQVDRFWCVSRTLSAHY